MSMQADTPNKPFHLTPGLAPCGRSVRRRWNGGVERQRMTDTPKRLKRLLREHAGEAHEEELRRALVPVAEAFKRWEHGGLDSGEMSDLIHRFHQGPARELFLRYNASNLVAPVAHAIAVGIVDRTAVPGELLEHLTGMIEFYEKELATS